MIKNPIQEPKEGHSHLPGSHYLAFTVEDDAWMAMCEFWGAFAKEFSDQRIDISIQWDPEGRFLGNYRVIVEMNQGVE